MWLNYFKTALRNLNRHRGNAALNILGLAGGIACALVILLVVRTETSYDGFHEQADRLYRVTYEEINTPGMRHLATVSPPMGPALVEEYPEIEAFVRLRTSDRHLVATEDRQFYENTFLYADSTFFDLFTFPLHIGRAETALATPEAIVLTHETALKYFGRTDILGEGLTFDDERRFTVTGVLAPLPGKTHLNFDFLLPFSAFRVPRGYPVTLESWGWISFHVYVLLTPGADAGAVEAKLPDFMRRHFDDDRAESVRLQLQPVTDIYLGEPKHPVIASGNPAYVYGLSGIALLIVLLACFNFMNLTSAHVIQRRKEAGVRKVLGARAADLVYQFLGEAVLMAGIGLALAIVLVAVGLEGAQRWSDLEVVVHRTDWFWLIPVLGGAAVVMGIASGWYPAVLASRFQPVQMLKGSTSGFVSGTSARRVLIVLQFAIAITLMVGSVVVTRQMEFVRSKELGFDREHVVALHMRGEDLLGRYPILRRQLLQHPAVANVTQSGHLFDGDQGSVPIQPEGGAEQDLRAMSIYGVHFEFYNTLGIEVVEGRVHDEAFPADSADGVVLNQAAVRYFASTTPGWEAPIGKRIQVGDIMEGRVIGVVEDFHFASLHTTVEPLVMYIPPTTMEHILVRLSPGSLPDQMAALHQTWEQIAPDRPFDFTFLDDRIQTLYATDQRFFRLIMVFSGLATFIACLGASLTGIVALLTRPFVGYVLVANLIAWPLAYWGMSRWLDDFAYRIDLGVLPFLLAGGLTLLVAVVTMSRKSIQTALVNPVQSIRSE